MLAALGDLQDVVPLWVPAAGVAEHGDEAEAQSSLATPSPSCCRQLVDVRHRVLTFDRLGRLARIACRVQSRLGRASTCCSECCSVWQQQRDATECVKLVQRPRAQRVRCDWRRPRPPACTAPARIRQLCQSDHNRAARRCVPSTDTSPRRATPTSRIRRDAPRRTACSSSVHLAAASR